MSSPIVQPSAFSVSKVSISQPRVLDSGAKLAFLNYGERASLVMQTPSLQSPFGLKDSSTFDKNSAPKYSIDLALRGYQDNTKVKAIYDSLTALDEYMIDQGVKNSKLWFKTDMKREVVEAFYTRTVKFGRDKEGNPTAYPPNLKLQLRKRRDRDEFETDFYDEKSKTDPNAKPLKGIPVEEMLVKKVEVTALMQCTGVWFSGGKFGLSWKAVQVRLDSVPASLGRGPAFQADVDEDDEDDVPFKSGGAAFAEPAEFSVRPPQPTEAQSDEEGEDEEVAPAPVPKKKAPMTIKKVLGAVAKK